MTRGSATCIATRCIMGSLPSLYPWCSAGWFQRRAATAFYKRIMAMKIDRVNAMTSRSASRTSGLECGSSLPFAVKRTAAPRSMVLINCLPSDREPEFDWLLFVRPSFKKQAADLTRGGPRHVLRRRQRSTAFVVAGVIPPRAVRMDFSRSRRSQSHESHSYAHFG
jgi:hypothetical protein